MYTSRLLEKAANRQAAATITKDATTTPATPTSFTVRQKCIFECIETSKKCHSPKILF